MVHLRCHIGAKDLIRIGLTQAEKTATRVTTRVSIFDPKTCPNREMSNGTNGALLDALMGVSSIFDEPRFLGLKNLTLISKFVQAFSGLNRVPIRKCSMAQMEPSWMRLRSYEAFSDHLDFMTLKC
jgi:hypothetical protein